MNSAATKNGAGNTVSYSYDDDGNTTSITYPLGAGATWASSDTVNYGYDDADELDSVTDFNGTTITDRQHRRRPPKPAHPWIHRRHRRPPPTTRPTPPQRSTYPTPAPTLCSISPTTTSPPGRSYTEADPPDYGTRRPSTPTTIKTASSKWTPTTSAGLQLRCVRQPHHPPRWLQCAPTTRRPSSPARPSLAAPPTTSTTLTASAPSNPRVAPRS